MSIVSMILIVKVKFSLYRPWRILGLREVEAPTFSDIRLTDGLKVVSPTRRPLFYPQEDSWYSFLLDAESTSAAGRIRSIEKSTSSGTRTGDLPACSIVPQPTTLPMILIVTIVIIILRRVNRFVTLSLTDCIAAVTFPIPQNIGKLSSLIEIQNLVFRIEIDKTLK
jgi:hypothetical protein